MEPQWYAYEHEDHGMVLKRYADFINVLSLSSIPEVKRAVGPFSAEDKKEALKKAKELMP